MSLKSPGSSRSPRYSSFSRVDGNGSMRSKSLCSSRFAESPSGSLKRSTLSHQLTRSGGSSETGAKSATLPVFSLAAFGETIPLLPTSILPEDLASQLTLLDLPVFQSIRAEELSSCSWNKKNKRLVAPNIVSFTQRFNHVAFWTVQEILRSESIKTRAEVLAHFIKVAKKLDEYNSLHAQFSILSALQSAPIYRLRKTWAALSRKDKVSFEKLCELFSEEDNFCKLRNHMNGTVLKNQPCIPYLGLYLTDLVYVDMAHPTSGGIESQQRTLKMNNILRIVSELQQSNYSHLSVNSEVQQYLKSIRYIDELQKFLEDDHYKRSLILEPNSPAVSSSSSKESVRNDSAVVAELNLSPSTGLRTHTPRHFVPGHRKSRSDGGNIFLACSGRHSAEPWSSEEKLRSLLDDSLLEEENDFQFYSSHGNLLASLEAEKHILTRSQGNMSSHSSQESSRLSSVTKCTFQSSIKRKSLIKDGRRPTMTVWQKYWLQLWGSSLVYYSPKALVKGNERRDFRCEPSKYQSILGWMVMIPDSDSLSFTLTDPIRRNVYRFRSPSLELAKNWCKSMSEAVQPGRTPPANLISFE